jgi:periplasmic divalent cation tolerance protein
VTSVYRWQGAVEEAEEVLVMMKTRPELVERLTARAVEMHPYEVPELLALPVAGGLAAYCRWVAEETEGGA